MQNFETRDQAQQRAEKRKAEEELGNFKKKRHSPDPSQVNFDKEALLNEVRQMETGQMVIFLLIKLCSVRDNLLLSLTYFILISCSE